MFRRIILLSLIILIVPSKIKAQNQWFYANFNNICDDREYLTKYAMNQVILGARLDAGSGFKIDSIYQVFAGMNYMFEYGSNPFALRPVPDLYFKSEVPHFRMFFGSFPRYKLLNYPLLLLTDSIQYYRPNIQGGLMEYSGEWGYQNAWCDWTSRQTYTDHETFLAGASGHFQNNLFYIENYFCMFHLAGTKTKATSVRDNGGGAVYFGVDFAGKTFLDKCNFDIGGIGNYDRIRPLRYNHYWGIQGRASFFYKYFGIDATYYKGHKLALIWGEPFYTCGNYGRLDAYVKLWKTKHIDSKIGWSFHFVNGQNIDNSFQVLFRVDFLNKK